MGFSASELCNSRWESVGRVFLRSLVSLKLPRLMGNSLGTNGRVVQTSMARMVLGARVNILSPNGDASASKRTATDSIHC